MRSLTLTILLFHLIVNCTQGQNKETDDHYKQLEERYRQLRDSLSLLHPFIPAISSVMISKDQLEVNLFNSLITANRYRDNDGNNEDIGYRQTYFYSTMQLTYGVSPKSKINV